MWAHRLRRYEYPVTVKFVPYDAPTYESSKPVSDARSRVKTCCTCRRPACPIAAQQVAKFPLQDCVTVRSSYSELTESGKKLDWRDEQKR
ncbi:MAG: hypothetical protein BGP05_20600 [Rhizobiales bacterium 62-47]|nr:MAG: hypothetical protein BGP05_20600 [Rhizobiales bacterium 62-47]